MNKLLRNFRANSHCFPKILHSLENFYRTAGPRVPTNFKSDAEETLYNDSKKVEKSLQLLDNGQWVLLLLLQKSAIYYIYITIYYIYITIYNSTSYNIIQEHGPTVTTRLRDELAKFTSMSHSLVL